MIIIDSDAHSRDLDEFILPYLNKYISKNEFPLFPMENYPRTFSGRFGFSGALIKERLKAMSVQNIDLAVLYPTYGLSIGLVQDDRYAIALCQGYNDFIAAYCKKSDKLRAIALLPINNPRAAALELRRAITELRLCGGLLAAQGHRNNLGNKMYYPLYEEAQRLNTPLSIHAFGGDDLGSSIFDKFISIHTVGHPFPVIRQLTGIIFGGIPERFPSLRLGFFETGCGWIPYWFERMDGEWEKRGDIEAVDCQVSPSEYLLKGNIYFSCEPDEKMIDYVVKRYSSEIILYASDYPHWDMKWPESSSLIMGNTNLSTNEKINILYNNALDFYNIEFGSVKHQSFQVTST